MLSCHRVAISLPKKKFNLNKWSRKVHYWGAFVVALPVLIIFSTGIFLQLKKDFGWIQPPTQVGSKKNLPSITFDEILESAKSAKNVKIYSWDDIDRLDVRPEKGIVKVRSKEKWELQIDTETGVILQEAYRRSDLIESIHDGSWFNSKVKYFIFFPSGIILLVLWLTGIYLVLLPYQKKWQKRVFK